MHCVVIIVYMADASRIVWGALTSPVSVRCAGGISWDSSEGARPGAESQEQNPRGGLARALQGGLSFLPRNKIPSLWEAAD